MKPEPTKIVVIRSLAYSGTTWINLVLGSHPSGLALGPPLRVWKLDPADADQACRVHPRGCDLWAPFIRDWDRRRSFFLQLAEHTGKRLLVLNNPLSMDRREFRHRGLEVKYVYVVRDGRANVASLVRHDADRFPSYYEAVRQWLQPHTAALRREMEQTPERDRLLIRYEDAMADPRAMLDAVGGLVGETYPDNAVRFWEYEHHPVGGNAGTITMLRQMAGALASPRHQRREAYDQILAVTRRRPDVRVIDETWRDNLSLQDRFVYDLLMGDLHAELGYRRDRFTVAETRSCLEEWGLELDSEEYPDSAPRRPRRATPMPFDDIPSIAGGDVVSYRGKGAHTTGPEAAPGTAPEVIYGDA